MAETITIKRGTDKTINLNFNRSNGDPIDITDWKIFFTVRTPTQAYEATTETDDTNSVIHKEQESHVDAVNGQSSIVLSNEDTNIKPGTYLYDVQIIDASGNISTPVVANFVVNVDVTRATS
jgi:hypothetical protein